MKSDCNRVRTGQSGTPTRSKKSNTYIIASSAPGKTKAVGRYKENGKAWTSRTSNRDASRRSRKIMGIAELEAYIAELEAEISRVRVEIAAKLGQRRGAEALFKR